MAVGVRWEEEPERDEGSGRGGIESDDHLVAASPTKKRLRVRTKASSSSPRPKKKKASSSQLQESGATKKKKKSQSWCRGWRRAAEKAERVLRFRYEETVTGLREPFRL